MLQWQSFWPLMLAAGQWVSLACAAHAVELRDQCTERLELLNPRKRRSHSSVGTIAVLYNKHCAVLLARPISPQYPLHPHPPPHQISIPPSPPPVAEALDSFQIPAQASLLVCLSLSRFFKEAISFRTKILYPQHVEQLPSKSQSCLHKHLYTLSLCPEQLRPLMESKDNSPHPELAGH